MIRTAAGDIDFQKEGWVYIYKPDGVVLPSITTLVKEVLKPYTGVSVEAEHLEWLGRRGTAVHRAIELHAEGDLDEDSLAPPVLGFFLAYLQAEADLGIVPEMSEVICGSRAAGFAGRTDFIGGVAALGFTQAIIDFKTSASPWPHYGTQVGGYAIGVAETYGSGGPVAHGNGIPLWVKPEDAMPRVVLYLRENGKYVTDVYTGAEGITVPHPKYPDTLPFLPALYRYHEGFGGWDGWLQPEEET